MKIYTKTGDDGSTGLFSGDRVKKNAANVEAYGSVDELNSVIGWVRSATTNDELSEKLFQIQHDLFVVGSDLATPLNKDLPITRMQQDRIECLEQWIDEAEKVLEPLQQFILPGGGEVSSRLHFSRTVSRRVERRLLSCAQEQSINELNLVYLNRLSDLLFVLARLANHIEGQNDIPWDKTR